MLRIRTRAAVWLRKTKPLSYGGPLKVFVWTYIWTWWTAQTFESVLFRYILLRKEFLFISLIVDMLLPLLLLLPMLLLLLPMLLLLLLLPMFQMIKPLLLFCFVFVGFKNGLTHLFCSFSMSLCWKRPSSIQGRYSNSRPLDYEYSPLATSPRFLLFSFLIQFSLKQLT